MQNNESKKFCQHLLSPCCHFVSGVSGGIVALGYFSFYYNETACYSCPCGFDSEGLPKAWINERLWYADLFLWRSEDTVSIGAGMPTGQGTIFVFSLNSKARQSRQWQRVGFEGPCKVLLHTDLLPSFLQSPIYSVRWLFIYLLIYPSCCWVSACQDRARC